MKKWCGGELKLSKKWENLSVKLKKIDGKFNFLCRKLVKPDSKLRILSRKSKNIYGVFNFLDVLLNIL